MPVSIPSKYVGEPQDQADPRVARLAHGKVSDVTLRVAARKAARAQAEARARRTPPRPLEPTPGANAGGVVRLLGQRNVSRAQADAAEVAEAEKEAGEELLVVNNLREVNYSGRGEDKARFEEEKSWRLSRVSFTTPHRLLRSTCPYGVTDERPFTDEDAGATEAS